MRGPPERKQALSVHELADFLGVPVPIIYQWRSKRYGTIGLRVGEHVRYRPADVERWLATPRREWALDLSMLTTTGVTLAPPPGS